MDEETLAKAIMKAFEQHDAIYPLHREDHDFIQMLKRREERRIQTWNKFRMSFVGAVAIGVVSLLMWVGKIVIDHIGHMK